MINQLADPGYYNVVAAVTFIGNFKAKAVVGEFRSFTKAFEFALNWVRTIVLYDDVLVADPGKVFQVDRERALSDVNFAGNVRLVVFNPSRSPKKHGNISGTRHHG